MSKISDRPTVLMPTVEEDKAITAAARSDPDAQPLTPQQLKSMRPIQEVVEFFKSTGEGWQSRMDGVLRQYVEQHSRNT